MAMLRAGAEIIGYELREDFAARAQANVERFLGPAALERRARVAGVPHFSPHACRRTFIGDLLRRCGHEYRQGACRAREHRDYGAV